MRRLWAPCALASDGPRAAAAAVAPEYLRKDLRMIRRFIETNLSRGLIRPPIPTERCACQPMRATRLRRPVPASGAAPACRATRLETAPGRDAGRYLLTAEAGRGTGRVRQALGSRPAPWRQRGWRGLSTSCRDKVSR